MMSRRCTSSNGRERVISESCGAKPSKTSVKAARGSGADAEDEGSGRRNRPSRRDQHRWVLRRFGCGEHHGGIPGHIGLRRQGIHCLGERGPRDGLNGERRDVPICERLNGVDFRKGCYVGQEVTARMKHKTELRKGLATVAVDGSAQPGTPIEASGKAAGTLFTQAGGQGIAYLRFDRAGPDMRAGDARVSYPV